ncbi:MAG: RNA methyltransferase [Propionibacteriaceae bacterium]|nr:RNA methyltransferase [Propionibacteriaceae bacterium]
MAPIIDVEAADDPRVRHYTGLREATLRRNPEVDGGIFIAESPLVVRRAVAAGYKPVSFLLTPHWVEELADVWSAGDAPVYRVSSRLAESITGFHVHRGALAALRRTERWRLADLLAVDRLVVAEDLVDHANVGAIARSAAGLGWDGLLVSADSADPLYRRSVKTSMGAVLTLPWVRTPPAWDGPAALKQAGFLVAALAPRPGALSLDALRRICADRRFEELAQRPVLDAPLREDSDQTTQPNCHRASQSVKLALFCGSEGPGLSEATLAAADVIVGIPMARSTDSLNVAAAVAIACYALGPAGQTETAICP